MIFAVSAFADKVLKMDVRSFASFLLIVWALFVGKSLIALPRVKIRDTELRFFKSKLYGKSFEIDVFLPKDYAKNKKEEYPAVYVLDAEYNFGLVSYVARRLIKNREIPKVILVGIAYNVAYDEFYESRQRDYTPTKSKKYNPSGEAATFAKFIREELIGYVEKHYRVKKEDRAIVGHSYGGLFGYYALFNQPGLFSRYLLVSPSLWYGKRVSFQYEREYAKSNKDLRATLFTSIGSRESYMVDDLQKMVKNLEARKYKGLKLDFMIHHDETHRSVFATAFTKGIKSIFKDSRP